MTDELLNRFLFDIKQLFINNYIRPDGQIKRIPGVFAPWTARNPHYSQFEKKLMMPIVCEIATLNFKNIWQFNTTNYRDLIARIKYFNDLLIKQT